MPCAKRKYQINQAVRISKFHISLMINMKILY